MRINKPQLFNGQYLASRDEIFGLLGLGFNSSADGVVLSGNALISSSLIPWTEIAPSTIISKVNGSNLKISAETGAQTIIDYVGAVSGNLSTAIENAITGAVADASVISGNLNTVSGDLDILSGNVAKIGLVKTSALQYTFTDATGASAVIDIPKDQFLKNAAYVPSAEVLRFEFALTDDKTEPGKVVDIPVGALVDEYTAGSGIVISDLVDGKNTVSVKLANGNESFLTVSEAGLKLDGVQTAIDIASGAAYTTALAEAKVYANELSAAVSGAAAAKFGLVDQAITDANTLIGTTSGAVIEYVNTASGNLDTAINTASGAAYTKALAEAKAYADEVSGAATAQFTAEAAAREAADKFLSGSIDYVSGKVSGVAGYEVFGSAVSSLPDLPAAEADKLAKVGAVKDYVDAEVSKAVAGDVADLLEGKVDKTQIASEVVAGDGLPTNDAVITYVTGYVAGHNAVYTTENFADPADKTLTGLYVSAEGETRFWDGTDFIATSEEVADKFDGALSGAIPTVKAVKDYVSGQVAATIETVNTKAVEMIEDDNVEFGTDKDAEVSGRVIAVYFADGEQCYPSISYANGISTISADAPVSSYTVIYAKRIGQTNGELPEYPKA